MISKNLFFFELKEDRVYFDAFYGDKRGLKLRLRFFDNLQTCRIVLDDFYTMRLCVLSKGQKMDDYVTPKIWYAFLLRGITQISPSIGGGYNWQMGMMGF